MYAYYTAEGIWATGRTPEEAIETFVTEGKLSQEEIEALGPIQTAPMTARLAEYVERHGFECGRDRFQVRKDGLLDLETGVERHPRAGDIYAVRYGADGEIIEAYGPLRDDHVYRTDELDDILTNQQDEEALRADAVWLRRELEA